MIKIDREDINKVKLAIYYAMQSARTSGGLKIKALKYDDKTLERCAMLAIQAATMEAFGPFDVASQSDVHHFIKEEIK